MILKIQGKDSKNYTGTKSSVLGPRKLAAVRTRYYHPKKNKKLTRERFTGWVYA
jgi:hypothetical protein